MSEHDEDAPMLPCPHCSGHGVMHWITYDVYGDPTPAYEECYHCEATGEVPARVAIEHALRVEASRGK